MRQGFLLLGVATNAHQVASVNRFLAQCVRSACAQGYAAYGFAGLHQDTPDMAAALESARAGGEELSSLRAGDLTVTKRASGESGRRLEALCAQARMLMRPYTKDGSFCFFGVQG